MGDYALREVENWLSGRPLENPIDLETVFERGVAFSASRGPHSSPLLRSLDMRSLWN